MGIAINTPTAASTRDILGPSTAAQPPNRLASLDVFRGMVILAMLLVNNIGDSGAVGYFWAHADWRARPLVQAFKLWWPHYRATGWAALSDLPLLRNCTLADYVMPMFMLIIGIAIPFSAAAARRRGKVGTPYWLGVVRRGLTLYALGWCINLSLQLFSWRYRTNIHDPLVFVLGMDVLQLLGISYIFARLIYCLPAAPRLAIAGILFIAHWALLRLVPQGMLPAGTFTEAHNVPGYLYGVLWIFHSFSIASWLRFNIVGMLSVPPAVATMVLGTWMGDTLRNTATGPRNKIRQLIVGGIVMVLVGLAWSCDLPMNKPRWTPCYLVYCAGVGALCSAFLYWLIDVRQRRRWTWLFSVLGMNAIGIYFLSIMAKVWLLDMPRVVDAQGIAHPLIHYLIVTLQTHTSPWLGSWLFTSLYVCTVWCFAAAAYQKRLFWKV